jgi:hypothetical protein
MFPTLPDLTPQLLSTLLGYASIACWIIAQAPQVVENYFQQSCDGLALPFLLNWLCGDITNVIGCILTDQKEFQVRHTGSRLCSPHIFADLSWTTSDLTRNVLLSGRHPTGWTIRVLYPFEVIKIQERASTPSGHSRQHGH